jgi:CRISPR-associated endonuclease/helicase Cas3
MLLGSRAGSPQGLRHEWLTVVILRQQQISAWARKATGFEEIDWTLIEWAVSGHHPKYQRPSPPTGAPEGCGSNKITALLSHPDFKACLDLLAGWFGLIPFAGELLDTPFDLGGGGQLFAGIGQGVIQASAMWSGLGPDVQRLVSAAKNCLIAADVAGSALPEQLDRPQEQQYWIPKVFDRRPTAEQFNQVVSIKLGTKPLRTFQAQVRDSSSAVTLVRAGCGSGKTAAAYAWAAKQCAGRRLYFCYPTTGTATEGFRDYLYPPEVDIAADLFHGRADVDKRIILQADDDEDDAGDELARIESLDAWSTPVVVCTVDTVLGAVRNNRRGLYAWPALAGAAFVFDEIHSYDDDLFGALLRFVQHLPGVPVLLMTATLQNSRRRALDSALARRRPAARLNDIPGPEDLELLPRYAKQTADSPLRIVADEIAAGGKVLWVCNTVARAMAAANDALKKGLKPLVYHSRFRYEDRVVRHKAVIDAFGTNAPGLAICTQVAECSLDLSATLLVSDLGPVPSLIQRLGRLNRSGQCAGARFVISEPDRSLPYKEADLVLARQWLALLPEREISQRALALAWQSLDSDRGAVRPSPSEWLDDAYLTKVGDLRAPGIGVTVVLSGDAAALRGGAKRAAQVALPMPTPRDLNWRAWPKVRGLPVAPPGSIQYDLERGAEWNA